jgi:hypothetical protein
MLCIFKAMTRRIIARILSPVDRTFTTRRAAGSESQPA